MSSRLPHEIDAMDLADRNANIQGDLEISCFDRLADVLADNTGTVAVTLTFGKKGRLATIEGHVSAVLAVKCQRCLDTIEWPIDNDIQLGIVSSAEQVKNLPRGVEPLLLPEDGKIQLKALVEDELLLGLPDIPKHQVDCLPPLVSVRPDVVSNDSAAKKTNPFSVLADLKNLETKNGSTKK